MYRVPSFFDATAQYWIVPCPPFMLAWLRSAMWLLPLLPQALGQDCPKVRGLPIPWITSALVSSSSLLPCYWQPVLTTSSPRQLQQNGTMEIPFPNGYARTVCSILIKVVIDVWDFLLTVPRPLYQVKLISTGTFGCTYALLWHGEPIAAIKTARAPGAPIAQQEIDALIRVSKSTPLQLTLRYSFLPEVGDYRGQTITDAETGEVDGKERLWVFMRYIKGVRLEKTKGHHEIVRRPGTCFCIPEAW